MKKAKLILIRKQNGYTQKQVADYIATDVSNYSRKEKGTVSITLKEWEKLAQFFNVSVDYIYENDDSITAEYLAINDEKIKVHIDNLESENSKLKEDLYYLKKIEDENSKLKEIICQLKNILDITNPVE